MQYRELMEKYGLMVSEKEAKHATLDGSTITYRAVTGYRQGVYRITIRLEPMNLIHVVVDAGDKRRAQSLAEKLEELGFNVDVDEERVRASSRGLSLALVKRTLDIVDKNSGGENDY
jgi:hypothetical protein